MPLFSRLLLMGLLSLTLPVAAWAHRHDPSPAFSLHCMVQGRAIADTLPKTNATTTTETPEKKETELIKEVPKSKKQVKPVAITVNGVKPIQVIKPKIIKPIIKIN